MNDIDRYIAARLKLWRSRRGLSLAALGDALGLSYQQVQKYENGRNRISASTLCMLATALDIPPSAMLPDGRDTKEMVVSLDGLSERSGDAVRELIAALLEDR